MIVPQYIRDLLLEGKNVSVAGLGSFECTKVPAGFDKEKKLFLPPSRSISFHFGENVKGSEFAYYVAEKESVKLEDAQRIIEDAVDEINYQLDRGKRLRYNTLGLFYRDKDNRIVFEADPQLLKGGEFFGLNPVPLSSGKKMNAQFFKRILAVALILVCTAAGGYWGYIMWQMIRDHKDADTVPALNLNPTPEKKVISSPGQMALDSIRNQITPTKPAPDLNKAGETAGEDTEPQKAQEAKARPEETINRETATGPRYYVVAGSFRSAEGAKKFVKQLQAKGYKSELFGQSESGLNMVCYTSFATREEADKALAKIRAEENNAAYILKR